MILTLKDSGGRKILALKIIGKEESEGWLMGEVEFDYNSFSAYMAISLMHNDLISFFEELQELDRTLMGKAYFCNIENNVILTITTDGLGHLNIEGVLRHPHQFGLKIEFEFESDQTFLRSMLAEVRSILNFK